MPKIITSKPQAQDVADDVDSADEIENDLEILNNMNIDKDFNIWDDFRSSMSVKGRRESLESLISRSSKVSRSSILTTAAIIEGVTTPKDKFEVSEKSISGNDFGDGPHGIASELSHSGVHGDHDESLDVSFSQLTPGEQRDIRAWNIRLERETVYSRYYFPEAWETRELKTIAKFLELHNPKEIPWFLNEPGKEITKAAITSIFYPGDHDPKSVLLKRGPILFDGVEEMELLLFTHGFLFSRMECDTLLNLLFTINSENPEYLSSAQLKDRFSAIDSDGSGALDRCELKEIFKGMGVPIGEKTLSQIMERFDSDDDGQIDFQEFESVMRDLEPKPKKEERWSLGRLGEKLKQSLTQEISVDSKLECAWQFSDVEMIESVNMCYSEETQMFAHSSWADLIVAIYVKGRAPLIMVCSKPEHRAAWVDAFQTCYVKSIQLKAQNGYRAAKQFCSQVGWQWGAIRASLFSLVVCNDLRGLQDKVSNPPRDMHIDDQDEYRHFTALHYAAALGHLDCAELLLKAGARVNFVDNDDKTALDHAVLAENKEMIHLLERHGAKKNTCDVLFKSAVEEQKQLRNEQTSSKAKKTIAKAKEATSAMGQAMSAMRERGERLERLDNKTAQLQDDASNYADMAKKLKEKQKKKATFFGL